MIQIHIVCKIGKHAVTTSVEYDSYCVYVLYTCTCNASTVVRTNVNIYLSSVCHVVIHLCNFDFSKLFYIYDTCSFSF